MPKSPNIIIDADIAGENCVSLNSPTALPNANGFLWNKAMVMQVNCRGYITSQFMQPEPAKYSHAPNMEAKSFIQPEHNYFSHHPGRFFYLKDDDTGEIISLPYEPMRIKLERFSFRQTGSEISWLIVHKGLTISIAVNLTTNDLVELWSIHITNNTAKIKHQLLSLFFYRLYVMDESVGKF
jgi:cellobionic acid phosphorylase